MHKKKLTAAVATVALISFASAAPVAAQDGDRMTKRYQAEATSLNGSGTTASASARLTRQTVQMDMTVRGLTPDGPHAQHLHGRLGERNVCPGPEADTDGDGLVSTPEGIPAYGGIQGSLTTEGDVSADSALAVPRFPVASNGTYRYQRTFDLPGEVAWYFGSLHVVVHGIDLNRNGMYDMGPGVSPLADDVPFEVTIPAACGVMRLVGIDLPATYRGTSGAQGSVTRMYALMLNREPDAGGFQFWTGLINRGVSVYAIATAFNDSPEFQQRFGARLRDASDAEWVDFVYRATFGRAADDQGRQYWIGELASPRLDRAGMLVSFAMSQEFRNLTGTS